MPPLRYFKLREDLLSLGIDPDKPQLPRATSTPDDPKIKPLAMPSGAEKLARPAAEMNPKAESADHIPARPSQTTPRNRKQGSAPLSPSTKARTTPLPTARTVTQKIKPGPMLLGKDRIAKEPKKEEKPTPLRLQV